MFNYAPVAIRRTGQPRRLTTPWTDWLADRPEADRFVWQLDALLRQLGDVHLRISLARLSVEEINGDGRCDPAIPIGQAIADNLLDPCAMAGVMPDGSVVAAFLGPRSNAGAAGDDEIAHRIHRGFQLAIGAMANQNRFSPSRLAIVHGWTDEFSDLPSMADELGIVPPAMVKAMQIV